MPPLNDRPSRELVPAREVRAGGQRDPREEPSELEQLRTDVRDLRTLIQGQARTIYRSQSPAAGTPAVRTEAEEQSTQSMRPGRELLGAIVRRTDPKWLGLAVVIALLIWGLGGPQGIHEKCLIAMGSREKDAKLAELERRIQKSEERDTARDRYDVAERDDEVDFRGQLRQLFERQGVQWDPAAGSPPERALRVTVPLRPRGTVTKGPSLIVDSPMPIPPPVPSAAP